MENKESKTCYPKQHNHEITGSTPSLDVVSMPTIIDLQPSQATPFPVMEVTFTK